MVIYKFRAADKKDKISYNFTEELKHTTDQCHTLVPKPDFNEEMAATVASPHADLENPSHELILEDESQEIMPKFRDLLEKTCQFIRGIPVHDLLLGMTTPDFQPEQKSTDYAVNRLRKYSSWWNYHLVEDVINKYGQDSKLQVEFENYRELFHQYVRTRIMPTPKLSISELPKSKPSVSPGDIHEHDWVRLQVMFADREYDGISMSDIKHLHYTLASALGIELQHLYLTAVRRGSIVLEFLIPRHYTAVLISNHMHYHGHEDRRDDGHDGRHDRHDDDGRSIIRIHIYASGDEESENVDRRSCDSNLEHCEEFLEVDKEPDPAVKPGLPIQQSPLYNQHDVSIKRKPDSEGVTSAHRATQVESNWKQTLCIQYYHSSKKALFNYIFLSKATATYNIFVTVLLVSFIIAAYMFATHVIVMDESI